MRMGESSAFGMSMGSGPATPDQISWFSVACLRVAMACNGNHMARKAILNSNDWRFGTMTYAGWDWAKWREAGRGTVEDELVAVSRRLIFRGLLASHALNNSDFDARIQALSEGRGFLYGSRSSSSGQSEAASEIHVMKEAGLRWTGSGLDVLKWMFELPADAQKELWEMGLQDSLASSGVLSEALDWVDGALEQCDSRVIQVQSITMNPFKSVDLGEEKIDQLARARASLERLLLDSQSKMVEGSKRAAARL